MEDYRNMFYLVQTGKWNERFSGTPKLNLISLFGLGIHSMISLDYMGAAEFEFGACYRSKVRIFNELNKYTCKKIDGILPENKDNYHLYLFAKSDSIEYTEECIKSFIGNPWPLKEYSGMEDISKFTSMRNTKVHFWWCIDNRYRHETDYGQPYPGDWMMFICKRQKIKKVIKIMEENRKILFGDSDDISEEVKKDINEAYRGLLER